MLTKDQLLKKTRVKESTVFPHNIRTKITLPLYAWMSNLSLLSDSPAYVENIQKAAYQNCKTLLESPNA